MPGAIEYGAEVRLVSLTFLRARGSRPEHLVLGAVLAGSLGAWASCEDAWHSALGGGEF